MRGPCTRELGGKRLKTEAGRKMQVTLKELVAATRAKVGALSVGSLLSPLGATPKGCTCILGAQRSQNTREGGFGI